MKIKTISASAFRTRCFATLAEVTKKRKSIVITRRGKPVAKLVPVNAETGNIFGFFQGKGSITGDIVLPAFAKEEWGRPT